MVRIVCFQPRRLKAYSHLNFSPRLSVVHSLSCHSLSKFLRLFINNPTRAAMSRISTRLRGQALSLHSSQWPHTPARGSVSDFEQALVQLLLRCLARAAFDRNMAWAGPSASAYMAWKQERISSFLSLPIKEHAQRILPHPQEYFLYQALTLIG